MAELHNPKNIKIELEQWENNSIMNLDDGILTPNEYLGFGADPKKGLFDE